MGKDDDRKFQEPPPGFVVMREADLYLTGRRDRWVARGIVNGRSIIRAGMRSLSSACRSAWFAWDDARTVLGEEPAVVNVAEVDSLVAEALARKHVVRREMAADPPGLRESYTVKLDDWAHMEASLLAEILADAGSIRKAAKIIDLARSTYSARVRRARERGTWPE